MEGAKIAIATAKNVITSIPPNTGTVFIGLKRPELSSKTIYAFLICKPLEKPKLRILKKCRRPPDIENLQALLFADKFIKKRFPDTTFIFCTRNQYATNIALGIYQIRKNKKLALELRNLKLNVKWIPYLAHLDEFRTLDNALSRISIL